VSEPAALVHVELAGITRLVGRLFVTARGRTATPTATLLYDQSWLQSPDGFALAPALTLSSAPHYTTPGHALFGPMGDSAPDRWGQTLLRRDERRRAVHEGRAPRALRDIDFLLGVSDTARQGALRFTETPGGRFVAPDGAGVPPLVDLPRLLAATERFLADEESSDDLRLLLAPGSSLGGARPKASVRDVDGALLIAKFPKRDDDEYRVVVWEAIALAVASAAGINTARHRVEDVAGRNVLLLHRFDRVAANGETTRVPFLSALSLLEASDGERRTYPEIADAIRQHGAAAREDLRELWRRMVFTVLISNTDDHLRNHGFLYDGPTGWRLSPAYDLNPVPADIKPRVLSTALGIDEDLTASLDIAMESAEYFGISVSEARTIVGDVARATADWRIVANRLGATVSEIDRMASAFEHADSIAARALTLR
jgi:serine/threonine-protein kinase HipA